MKSINQIFKDNPDLKQEPEVAELIEYCRDLEGQVMENKQSKQFSFEDKLTELVRDLYKSIKQTISEDQEAERFGELERIDYEDAVNNLKLYLEKFSEDNKFRL